MKDKESKELVKVGIDTTFHNGKFYVRRIGSKVIFASKEIPEGAEFVTIYCEKCGEEPEILHQVIVAPISSTKFFYNFSIVKLPFCANCEKELPFEVSVFQPN